MKKLFCISQWKCLIAILLLSLGCQICCHAQNIEIVQSKFGERQLEQMLDDRPEMRNANIIDSPVYKWLARGFDGEAVGYRIYWNGDRDINWVGVSKVRDGSSLGYISITSKSTRSPIDKWAVLVFEMHNIRTGEKIRELASLVVEGKLAKQEFALKCLLLEFAAQEQTRVFLRENPLPGTEDERNSAYRWLMSDLPDEKTYSSLQKLGWKKHLKHYEDHYDSVRKRTKKRGSSEEFAPNETAPNETGTSPINRN